MATLADDLQLAAQYQQAGDLRRAEQLCRQALRVDANNAGVWSRLAGVLEGRMTRCSISGRSYLFHALLRLARLTGGKFRLPGRKQGLAQCRALLTTSYRKSN